MFLLLHGRAFVAQAVDGGDGIVESAALVGNGQRSVLEARGNQVAAVVDVSRQYYGTKPDIVIEAR